MQFDGLPAQSTKHIASLALSKFCLRGQHVQHAHGDGATFTRLLCTTHCVSAFPPAALETLERLAIFLIYAICHT